MSSTELKSKTQSTWNKMVHAPFKKVVAFDLLCMAMGMPIGAGILAALLYGAKPLEEPIQMAMKVLGG
ncbi:MAG: hypothetical protein OEM28_07510 [Nitrosopumilus sp.]|nr:hypothetical protein [Nitrosopumilus sp.]MDH3488109.1 hypothetical protein [Nitrosopumilus sp.]